MEPAQTHPPIIERSLSGRIFRRFSSSSSPAHRAVTSLTVQPNTYWTAHPPPESEGDETLLDILLEHCRADPDKDFLGEIIQGRYRWMKHKQFELGTKGVAALLMSAGLEPGRSVVCICSANRPEWLVTQYACYRASLIPAPIYSATGPNTISYCLSNSATEAVVCSGAILDSIAACITPGAGSRIRLIICMDRTAEGLASIQMRMSECGVKVLTWDDVVNPTAEALFDQMQASGQLRQSKIDDVYAVLYTSGTAGAPKGAIITHRTARYSARTLLAAPQLRDVIECEDGIVHFSFLPMAHSLEQCTVGAVVMNGGKIGFIGSSIKKMLEDIRALCPTVMVTIPRVWKRFRQIVTELVSSWWLPYRLLFTMAYEHKLQAIRTGVPTWIDWDLLVFKGIAALLGGKVRLVISGGAALDQGLAEWVRVIVGAPVYQGYGLTETYGCTTLQLPDEGVGNVGTPLPGCEVAIFDVPEMNFFVTDTPPRGEIRIKGPVVFSGYHRDPEATATVFSDGWFSTGDVGQLNPNGTISLTDRKKNLFKLSQGEYVSAEYLEHIYQRASEVKQIWIWGDGQDTFIVAVVIPSPAGLASLAKDYGVEIPADFVEACKLPMARQLVLHRLTEVARDAGLTGFEYVRDVYLDPTPWTIQNGFMTATMKLKRVQLEAKYRPVLQAMREAVRFSGNAPMSRLPYGRSPVPSRSPNNSTRMETQQRE